VFLYLLCAFLKSPFNVPHLRKNVFLIYFLDRFCRFIELIGFRFNLRFGLGFRLKSGSTGKGRAISTHHFGGFWIQIEFLFSGFSCCSCFYCRGFSAV